jgi:subtilisin family serine protease
MAYEYRVMGQVVRLEPDEDLVAVRFAEPALHSTRSKVSAASGLGPFKDRVEIPNEKFTVMPVAQTPQARGMRHASAFNALSASQAVTRVAPVFKLGDRTIVATERVMVGFKRKGAKAEKTLKDMGLEIVEARDKEFLVKLPPEADPFEVAGKLAALKEVDYAEPDFVTVGRHVPAPPPGVAGPKSEPGPMGSGDPQLSMQYAPRITQAVEAWKLQSGDPSVIIAILDEGVDSQHEDLRDAIVGTYDGIDDDTFQEPNAWDGHGTACAGLAGAVANNDKGLRGIGAGCGLQGIRIAYAEAPNAGWTTSNSAITRAIDWAWQNGAAVLSNSWGGGAPSSAIINAFERARTQGRGGKGCVIVVAAGNDSGPVSFPGHLENVLTVSASNEFDEFKSKGSEDGETWWGSNFGPEVDVAAPGVHNLTTDISGEGGYSDMDYHLSFNGTSSACPIVAGAVGLLLSAKPDLGEAQARAIVKETADKVGALPYVGGRNDQFGAGRLNVLKMLQKVLGPAAPAPMQGSIKQLAVGNAKGAAYVLQTAQGQVFLLRHYTGLEDADRAVLEGQSLAYLAGFVGANRKVAYSRRQDTPQGAILWGATVV